MIRRFCHSGLVLTAAMMVWHGWLTVALVLLMMCIGTEIRPPAAPSSTATTTTCVDREAAVPR